MKLFKCLKSTVLFDPRDVSVGVSPQDLSYAFDTNLHKFFEGSEYVEPEINAAFGRVPEHIFEMVPLHIGLLKKMIDSAEAKNEYHTVEIITKLRNSLPYKCSDEDAIKAFEKKVYGMSLAMEHSKNDQVNHGLFWSNRCTYEQLVRLLKAELKDD